MNANAITDEYKSKIQFLESELETYRKRCEQYAQAYEQMQHQFKELLRNRFGKKSERYIDDRQLILFDSERPQPENNGEPKETTVVSDNRKKKNNKRLELPKHIEIIPVPENEKLCSCGCTKTVINYEPKELLHYKPAEFYIIEQRREVVACPNGCDGQMRTAPAPLQILPKTKVTEEFLAFLIISKIDDRQPLYHIEKQLFDRYGVDCSRQSMARWTIELVEKLQPLYNLMKDEAIGYDVASCDATNLQVLKEPNRRAETKSYVYCIRGGPPEKRVILYDYNDKLHKQFVNDWFIGFEGYLHVDGDNFFDLIGAMPKVFLANCNSHARRKFEPIAQSAKGKGLAKEAMLFFKHLYKIEREAKNNNLTPQQRYGLRQREAKPLLEKFKQWLDAGLSTVLPKSPLANAFNYCLNRWPGLTRFLEDGRLEIDNNLTEQEIKPFVIARKNFMFSSSVDGAHALCMHFSIVRTAKLHGLDPYHYYVKLLKSIPHCQSVDDYEKLLPWNIKL
jgi:transposase